MFRKKSVLIAVGALISTLLMGTTVCRAENEEEKITIRMLHYYGDTDTDISARYLKEILEEEFSDAFPDVELIQDTCDNETYKNKIKILMASDEEPDIMFSYGGGFMAAFVEAGKVLPLDEYLDDFYKERMNLEMQENFIYDGLQYGICSTSWRGVLYCNQELFEEADAEIPKTYEELLEACRKLRSSGIEPIALGMVNKWHGQQWINNFTIQLGGAEHYKKMAKGEISLNDPILAEAAQLTADLISEDAFCSNMYELTSSEAEELFLNGDAAMIYIGNWYTTLAQERLGDKLSAVKMPEISGAEYTDDYHGGGANGWIVSSRTEYPETAANIAAWISYRLSCYEPDCSSFVVEEEAQKTELSPVRKQILTLYEEKNEGGIAWDTLMKTETSEIWLDSCAKLFEGKMSGTEFAETLEERLRQGETH